MDIQAFRQPLQQSISQDSPAGSPVASDARLEFIANQMIKVGSLAHGEVDWDKTEQKMIHILCTQRKDIKLLSHLLQCLQNQATAERFVLAGFIATWWGTCYPVQGKKGERIRRRFFAQMEHGLAMSLRMRRQAIWSSITSAPDADADATGKRN
jgi:type VI secretion system protein VasJ